MNYKSPIEVAVTQMRVEQEKKLEGDIFRAIHEVGITVDKEQLIKALRYDRHQYEKGYNDGYDDGFDKGYDADKWLSVEREGLPDPKKYDWVLVYYKFRDGTPSPLPCVAELRDEEWWSVDDSYSLNELGYTVTHWQPLPAPPKEKPYD